MFSEKFFTGYFAFVAIIMIIYGVTTCSNEDPIPNVPTVTSDETTTSQVSQENDNGLHAYYSLKHDLPTAFPQYSEHRHFSQSTLPDLVSQLKPDVDTVTIAAMRRMAYDLQGQKKKSEHVLNYGSHLVGDIYGRLPGDVVKSSGLDRPEVITVDAAGVKREVLPEAKTKTVDHPEAKTVDVPETKTVDAPETKTVEVPAEAF